MSNIQLATCLINAMITFILGMICGDQRKHIVSLQHKITVLENEKDGWKSPRQSH